MIYFIAASMDAKIVAIKIGFTDSIRLRLSSLQSANHLPLSILATGAGGFSTEKDLHYFHSIDRIRNEWFKPSQAVMHSAEHIGDKAFIASLEQACSVKSVTVPVRADPADEWVNSYIEDTKVFLPDIWCSNCMAYRPSYHEHRNRTRVRTDYKLIDVLGVSND